MFLDLPGALPRAFLFHPFGVKNHDVVPGLFLESQSGSYFVSVPSVQNGIPTEDRGNELSPPIGEGLQTPSLPDSRFTEHIALSIRWCLMKPSRTFRAQSIFNIKTRPLR